MRRRAFLWTAAGSCVALARPRYGGTLRIQLSGPPPMLSGDASGMREAALSHLVQETLTRLNVRGELEPALALTWQSDAERKRWRFALRPNVLLHDGSPLTPAIVAEALKAYNATPIARGVQIVVAQPAPELPAALASVPIALTGPFREQEGKLHAFESHWAGRPFLDAIELLPPRTGALSTATADMWEIAAGPSRRAPDGVSIWSSSPSELIALDTAAVDPAIAAALSSAVDREPLTSVLTQKRGEPAWSLLPQWISGYSFVFRTARDIDAARESLTGVPATNLGIGFDPADSFARLIAERVAVNARDAGLLLRAAPGGQIRVRRIGLPPNAGLALRRIAEQFGMAEHVRLDDMNDPDLLYGAERILLESGKLVPLMHVPLVYAVTPRVQGLEAAQYTLPRLPLESVWMAL